MTNLLINATWVGKRVLFASKNNKAVDVVETRVNALGPTPVLLRVGAQASYQVGLAEYLLSLLSSATTDAQREDYAEAEATHEHLLAEHSSLAEELQAFVDLRNDTDRREQRAEKARRELDPQALCPSVRYKCPSDKRISAVCHGGGEAGGSKPG